MSLRHVPNFARDHIYYVIHEKDREIERQRPVLHTASPSIYIYIYNIVSVLARRATQNVSTKWRAWQAGYSPWGWANLFDATATAERMEAGSSDQHCPFRVVFVLWNLCRKQLTINDKRFTKINAAQQIKVNRKQIYIYIPTNHNKRHVLPHDIVVVCSACIPQPHCEAIATGHVDLDRCAGLRAER